MRRSYLSARSRRAGYASAHRQNRGHRTAERGPSMNVQTSSQGVLLYSAPGRFLCWSPPLSLSQQERSPKAESFATFHNLHFYIASCINLDNWCSSSRFYLRRTLGRINSLPQHSKHQVLQFLRQNHLWLEPVLPTEISFEMWRPPLS